MENCTVKAGNLPWNLFQSKSFYDSVAVSQPVGEIISLGILKLEE